LVLLLSGSLNLIACTYPKALEYNCSIHPTAEIKDTQIVDSTIFVIITCKEKKRYNLIISTTTKRD